MNLTYSVNVLWHIYIAVCILILHIYIIRGDLNPDQDQIILN